MQSLAEALQQLPASRELQAVLSYIFPTYGGYWPWAAPGPLEFMDGKSAYLPTGLPGKIPSSTPWTIVLFYQHCPPQSWLHGSLQGGHSQWPQDP